MANTAPENPPRSLVEYGPPPYGPLTVAGTAALAHLAAAHWPTTPDHPVLFPGASVPNGREQRLNPQEQVEPKQEQHAWIQEDPYNMHLLIIGDTRKASGSRHAKRFVNPRLFHNLLRGRRSFVLTSSCEPISEVDHTARQTGGTGRRRTIVAFKGGSKIWQSVLDRHPDLHLAEIDPISRLGEPGARHPHHVQSLAQALLTPPPQGRNTELTASDAALVQHVERTIQHTRDFSSLADDLPSTPDLEPLRKHVKAMQTGHAQVQEHRRLEHPTGSDLSWWVPANAPGTDAKQWHFEQHLALHELLRAVARENRSKQTGHAPSDLCLNLEVHRHHELNLWMALLRDYRVCVIATVGSHRLGEHAIGKRTYQSLSNNNFGHLLYVTPLLQHGDARAMIDLLPATTRPPLTPFVSLDPGVSPEEREAFEKTYDEQIKIRLTGTPLSSGVLFSIGEYPQPVSTPQLHEFSVTFFTKPQGQPTERIHPLGAAYALCQIPRQDDMDTERTPPERARPTA